MMVYKTGRVQPDEQKKNAHETKHQKIISRRFDTSLTLKIESRLLEIALVMCHVDRALTSTAPLPMRDVLGV